MAAWRRCVCASTTPARATACWRRPLPHWSWPSATPCAWRSWPKRCSRRAARVSIRCSRPCWPTVRGRWQKRRKRRSTWRWCWQTPAAMAALRAASTLRWTCSTRTALPAGRRISSSCCAHCWPIPPCRWCDWTCCRPRSGRCCCTTGTPAAWPWARCAMRTISSTHRRSARRSARPSCMAAIASATASWRAAPTASPRA
ncbi:hypothetical protein JaAD80_25555 [Janthinobacterium sp. AD80]|nr:hypothetical protein JaAD80_25555 [Janthinobacterium sp. AD80]